MTGYCDFTDWSVVHADARSVMYRPSGQTLVRRLGATLLAAMVVGVVAWSFGFPPSGGAVGQGVYWLVVGLCVLAGVLTPLGGVWQRLTIEKDIRGDLCVTRRGLTRSSRSFDKSDLVDLCVFAGEVYHRQRRPYVEKFLGWRWQVQLRCKATG